MRIRITHPIIPVDPSPKRGQEFDVVDSLVTEGKLTYVVICIDGVEIGLFSDEFEVIG